MKCEGHSNEACYTQSCKRFENLSSATSVGSVIVSSLALVVCWVNQVKFDQSGLICFSLGHTVATCSTATLLLKTILHYQPLLSNRKKEKSAKTLIQSSTTSNQHLLICSFSVEDYPGWWKHLRIIQF